MRVPGEWQVMAGYRASPCHREPALRTNKARWCSARISYAIQKRYAPGSLGRFSGGAEFVKTLPLKYHV